jgi:hypothetical protein
MTQAACCLPIGNQKTSNGQLLMDGQHEHDVTACPVEQLCADDAFLYACCRYNQSANYNFTSPPTQNDTYYQSVAAFTQVRAGLGLTASSCGSCSPCSL